MTCQDCGLTIESDDGSSVSLSVEFASIESTDRCISCEFLRWLKQRIIELKGEDDGRVDNGPSTQA